MFKEKDCKVPTIKDSSSISRSSLGATSHRHSDNHLVWLTMALPRVEESWWESWWMATVNVIEK